MGVYCLELQPPSSESMCPQNSVQTTIDSIIDFKYSTDDSIPTLQSVGGRLQSRDALDSNRNSESKCSSDVDIENNKPNRVRRVKRSEYKTNNINIEGAKIPRKINPKDYQTVDELMIWCRYWWIKRYRKDPDTWRRYENLLRDMASHPIFPIDLFNPKPNQVIAQLDYIEDKWINQREDKKDKSGTYAVKNRWKAIKALMHSYGQLREVNDNWNYTPPSRPQPQLKVIPSPKKAYDLVHYIYDKKDSYETALYQYLLTMSLHIGFRPASEMSILKVDDIDLDSGMLGFYQPKVDRWRYLALNKNLVRSSNTKCFKNWIDVWRPKVENQYSSDYMFIQPSGKPFTVAFLTKKLREMAKKTWPKYYPYSTRHWCATSYLIKTKVEKEIYGIRETCEFMDHSSFTVTEGYVKTATKWYNAAPYDWFQALLRFQKQDEKYKNPEYLKQQKGLERLKGLKIKKRGELPENTPVGKYGPPEARTHFLLLIQVVKSENKGLVPKVAQHATSILNLSFFFYIKEYIIIFSCVFFVFLECNMEIPYNIPYQYMLFKKKGVFYGKQ